jgi:2-polyprenyl-6-methoxyphenol hydroxylase-like FAD-dependent oxidoreductase
LKDSCDVLIVGGGPAGMVLALLLAQNGRAVTVIEKNPDFEREFRGEVLQPRFWHAVRDTVIDDVLKVAPHEKFDRFKFFIGRNRRIEIPLSKIDPDIPYITWMTQPKMLETLLHAARKYSSFNLLFGTSIKELIYSGDGRTVSGAICEDSSGKSLEIAAKIVVGADGRFSALRKLGDFKLSHSSHQFDVLWFDCKRPASFDHGADFFLGGEFNCIVLPKHPEKIQFGMLIRPGSFKAWRDLGPEKLAEKLDQIHPMFKAFSKDLVNFKSFTILKAAVERLENWSKDGLLMIGDAAHTCSPVGAIGVTIAVETAIVAADVINQCFAENDFSNTQLSQVQNLRLPAVLKIHRIQEIIGRLATNKLLPRKLIIRILPFIAGSPLAQLVLQSVISRDPNAARRLPNKQ